MRVAKLITSDTDKKFEPVAQIASAIFQITQEKSDCQPQDLVSHGFSESETKLHWRIAQSIAEIELKLMRTKEFPNSTRENSCV
jgi:hypothetical protein